MKINLIVIYIFVLFKKSNGQNICDTGRMQSPISILEGSQDILHGKRMSLDIDSYYNLYNVQILNNGHTVSLRFEEGNKPILRYSDSSLEYVLNEMHFHWDAEHVINGERAPLEAHFVHYLKKAGSFTNALQVDKGVIVMGVLYKFDIIHKANTEFTKISLVMNRISTNPNVTQNIRIVPAKFLPKKLNKFYIYMGSLTTPDCNEGIRWIIFDEPGFIRIKQYRKLITIYASDGHLVKKNFRALQPLNDRFIVSIDHNIYLKLD